MQSRDRAHVHTRLSCTCDTHRQSTAFAFWHRTLFSQASYETASSLNFSRLCFVTDTHISQILPHPFPRPVADRLQTCYTDSFFSKLTHYPVVPTHPKWSIDFECPCVKIFIANQINFMPISYVLYDVITLNTD